MNEELTQYLAKRRKQIESTKIRAEEVKNGSEIVEEHHIQSRRNSKITIPLCLSCHNYLTRKQNSLSVEQRKNSKIMALKSLLALQELVCEHLSFIIEREITNAEQDSD